MKKLKMIFITIVLLLAFNVNTVFGIENNKKEIISEQDIRQVISIEDNYSTKMDKKTLIIKISLTVLVILIVTIILIFLNKKKNKKVFTK